MNLALDWAWHRSSKSGSKAQLRDVYLLLALMDEVSFQSLQVSWSSSDWVPATLSQWKISNPRVIHFQQQSNFWKPRWFLPRREPFEERLGGRIALAAEIEIAGASIVAYDLHLESRANDELRPSQLEEVLRDAAAYDAARPIILSGDLNLNASKLGVTGGLACRGFRDAAPTARVATTPPHHWLEDGRHIDWAFVRDPGQIDKSRVHNYVKASDHYPISFDLRSSV